jgi:tRNA modification GTPase
VFERLNDTIVAVSSAGGSGPRGVIRLSGPDAFSIVDEMLVGDRIESLSGWTRRRVDLRVDGETTIPGEIYRFNRDRSYTRQDLVEVHTLGSPVLLSMALDRLVSLGARLAEAGEFTARGFFAGRMDLTEVEGVSALIRARSDAQLRAAEQLLHGRLASEAEAIQEGVADLLALVEAEIDFVDEPIDFISPDQIVARLSACRRRVESLLDASVSSERLDVLPKVLLVGPPNAGKSTLLNRLSGLDRAICSPLAGTTRDVLTAPIRFEQGEALLIDGAGLGLVRDDLDAQAAGALRRKMGEVDLTVLVVDASQPWDPRFATWVADVPERSRVLLANKVDLVKTERISEFFSSVDSVLEIEKLACSALEEQKIQDFSKFLENFLFAQIRGSGESVLNLNARHREALDETVSAFDRACEIVQAARQTTGVAELIAFELREAMDALGAILGSVSSDELLGRIFGRFCIGK